MRRKSFEWITKVFDYQSIEDVEKHKKLMRGAGWRVQEEYYNTTIDNYIYTVIWKKEVR